MHLGKKLEKHSNTGTAWQPPGRWDPAWELVYPYQVYPFSGIPIKHPLKKLGETRIIKFTILK